MNASNKLCFALDVATADEAQRYINLLKDSVGTFKIGLELFISSGPAVVHMVKASGAKCFLDLKLHDIPETVSRSVKRGINLGVDFLTIHASGGSVMMQAAVEAGKNTNLVLLGVTALTSLNDHDCYMVYNQERQVVVQDMMHRANKVGIQGFVCGVKELKENKRIYPDQFFLTPGIRTDGHVDDQKATGTPWEAIKAGADLLVVGRPIRDAGDPTKAAEGILMEIRRALGSNQ